MNLNTGLQLQVKQLPIFTNRTFDYRHPYHLFHLWIFPLFIQLVTLQLMFPHLASLLLTFADPQIQHLTQDMLTTQRMSRGRCNSIRVLLKNDELKVALTCLPKVRLNNSLLFLSKLFIALKGSVSPARSINFGLIVYYQQNCIILCYSYVEWKRAFYVFYIRVHAVYIRLLFLSQN